MLRYTSIFPFEFQYYELFLSTLFKERFGLRDASIEYRVPGYRAMAVRRLFFDLLSSSGRLRPAVLPPIRRLVALLDARDDLVHGAPASPHYSW